MSISDSFLYNSEVLKLLRSITFASDEVYNEWRNGIASNSHRSAEQSH